MVSLSQWGRRKVAFCVSHVAGRSHHHTALRKQDAQDAGSLCSAGDRAQRTCSLRFMFSQSSMVRRPAAAWDTQKSGFLRPPLATRRYASQITLVYAALRILFVDMPGILRLYMRLQEFCS